MAVVGHKLSRNLSEDDLDILRKCLSAVDQEFRGLWGVKNHISACFGGFLHSRLARLEKLGYVKKQDRTDGHQSRYVAYCSTSKGCDAIGFTHRETKKAIRNSFVEFSGGDHE